MGRYYCILTFLDTIAKCDILIANTSPSLKAPQKELTKYSAFVVIFLLRVHTGFFRSTTYLCSWPARIVEFQMRCLYSVAPNEPCSSLLPV